MGLPCRHTIAPAGLISAPHQPPPRPRRGACHYDHASEKWWGLWDAAAARPPPEVDSRLEESWRPTARFLTVTSTTRRHGRGCGRAADAGRRCPAGVAGPAAATSCQLARHDGDLVGYIELADRRPRVLRASTARRCRPPHRPVARDRAVNGILRADRPARLMLTLQHQFVDHPRAQPSRLPTEGQSAAWTVRARPGNCRILRRTLGPDPIAGRRLEPVP